MTQSAKIIDKIKKLKAKAESAHEIGSLEEAKVFAKKVKELVDKYKVDMSQVDFNNYDEENVECIIVRWSEFGHKDMKRSELWTRALAQMIARYCSCRAFSYKGSNRIPVYGRKTDLDIVEYMLKTMTPLCLKLCKKAYHNIYWEVRPLEEWERKAKLKGFKASWKMGFIQGVEAGLQEAEQSNEHALVRLSGMLVKVDEHITKTVTFAKGKGRRSTYQSNRDGYDQGYKTGKEIGRNAQS